MNFAPFLKQTLVSSFTKDQVLDKIRDKTNLINSDFSPTNAKFNGSVEENEFRLSLNVTTSQNALPLATGTVENTSRGSIIFLHLRLFPAGMLFLIFFTVMALLIGAIFLIFSKNISAMVVAILLSVANYLILNINFHRRAKETVDALQAILSPQN